MMLSRRQFLSASATSLAGCALSPTLVLEDSPGNEFDYVLIAKQAPITILPETATPALTFNGGFPAPVLRAVQGKPIRIKFINQLQQPTTIHWHGIRIDIAMDGVPHLTQAPIMPGETFIYEFVCPDAGTFWYHPHMNSVEQLGKGLVGALIVDEAQKVEFDTEVILGLKDWRLNDDGSFMPLSIPRQAARMGTMGNVKTVNGQLNPIYDIPASGTIRTRLLNLDNSRVFTISTKDFPAEVIAIDGNAVKQSFPLEAHPMGAGMRLDLGFVAPSHVGEEVIIYDRKGKFNFEICRLRTVASDVPTNQTLPSLPVNPIPAPNLDNAETIKFVFEWAGALSPVDKKGKVKREFWTINRRVWEGMSKESIPEPLATLTLGKTYIVELHNATPHSHPIHLHGHTFTVIESDKRTITPYHTDTILLAKNERAKIAFVADNPGRWMYHCHVIEHMKTGLMGYITVKK
jgi:FtsP/CotA-like multicopper oxidase with cupredoxin domain